jgi:hypothetical protein
VEPTRGGYRGLRTSTRVPGPRFLGLGDKGYSFRVYSLAFNVEGFFGVRVLGLKFKGNRVYTVEYVGSRG